MAGKDELYLKLRNTLRRLGFSCRYSCHWYNWSPLTLMSGGPPRDNPLALDLQRFMRSGKADPETLQVH